MAAFDIASHLADDHPDRGAGTDAERRAAVWLASECRTRRRDAVVETFWCRPNWPLAQAWHVALALAGSLVAVSHPKAGGVMVLAALLGVVADAAAGGSPGRLLTPERASQNVVSRSRQPDARVRLIIAANYDAGRTGLVYASRPRRLAAFTRRILGRAAVGHGGVLAFLLAWLIGVAIARNAGARHGAAIEAAQLVPTIALVIALALLAELALGVPTRPAANDNASGTAVAMQVLRTLDVAPPANLAVEIVLTGASDVTGAGLRAHLRTRRPKLPPQDTVVIGIAACGAGRPRWWISDGPLLPMRYLPRLAALCGGVAAAQPELRAAGHRGRGSGPALAARARGLPAITVGCLDETGLPPRSHSDEDTADRLDPGSVDSAVAFVLALVDEIDAEVARRQADERLNARAGDRHRPHRTHRRRRPQPTRA
jgi:hypothetical protein